VSRDIRAEGHRVVRAPVHRVWQLVSRPESHPRQVRWWLAADVIERAQSTALVEFRGLFGGLPVTSVQRMTLRPPGRVEFKQIRGTLRNLSGAFVLKDRGGDTDIVIQMTVDAGIPLLSEAAVQQILVGGIEATLTGLKATAERDLARPGRRQPAAPDGETQAEAVEAVEAAVSATSGDDDDDAAAGADESDEGLDGEAAVAVPESAASGQPAAGKRRRRRRGRRSTGSRPGTPEAGSADQAAGAGSPPGPVVRGRGPSGDGPPPRRRRRGRRGRGRGAGQPGSTSAPQG
jgi:hypothetical protein